MESPAAVAFSPSMTSEAQTSVAHMFIAACREMQVEIVVFVLAIAVHLVLFGNKFNPSIPSRSKGKAKTEAVNSPRNRQQKVSALSHQCEAWKRGGIDRASVASDLSNILKAVSPDAVEEALVELMEALGKQCPLEVCHGIRSFLLEQGAKPSSHLAELILRCFQSHHKLADFDSFLAEVDAQGLRSYGISLLAMKMAIKRSEVQSAIARMGELKMLWQEKTPSAAPASLVQQLTKLAMEQDLLDQLVSSLKEMNGTGQMLSAVVVEAARGGEKQACHALWSFANSSSVKALTGDAYASLLKLAENFEAASTIFNMAAEMGAVNAEVVSAALHMAKSAKFAGLESLVVNHVASSGSTPSGAVAAAVLRVQVGNSKDSRMTRETAQRVVEFLQGPLMGADLSNEGVAQQQVVMAAVKVQNSSIVRSLVESIPQHASQISLIKALGADQCLAEAQSVFNACAERTVCHYNALLDACVECGNLAAAKAIMSEASDAKVFDVVTFNTLVKAYLRVGKFQEACQVLDMMRVAAVQPNVVTFNELIDAAMQHSPQRTWPLIAEMKACGQRPNNVTCSILLKGVQQNSRGVDVEKTMAVVEDMDSDMDEILFSSAIEACIRANRADLLKPLLRRQRSPQRVPVRGAHTYGSMIRAYGYLHDLNGAWETWKEMHGRNIKVTSITVGCMVEALVSNDHVDDAYDLIQQMQKEPIKCEGVLNAVIYCSVLKGFSHRKRFDRVWVVYQEMLVYKLEFSIVTYNALIDACARSCDMSKIPSILQDMEKQGISPNLITYSTIVKGYCQENKLDKACQVMASMKETTKLVPDEIMYNSLLDGCARRGLYDRGMSILKEMQEAGIKPSNFTLSILAKLASRGKSLDTAFNLCNQLAKDYGFKFNTHVYNNLMHACVQHRSLPRALRVFKDFASARLVPDARTFAVVMRGCIASEDWSSAVGLVRLALQLPGRDLPMTSISVAPVKDAASAISAMVNELLEALLKAGEKELSVQLLHDLKDCKHNIRVDSRLKMKLTASACMS